MRQIKQAEAKMQSTEAFKINAKRSFESHLHVVGDEPYILSSEEDYPLEERLDALKRWGCGTHSFLTLYPGLKYFRIPGAEGYIPLMVSPKFVLIVGQPVCAPTTSKVLISALKLYATQNDCAILAVPTGESTKDLLASCGFRTMYVGREPIFDLNNLPKLSRSIRQAVSRVKRKGLKLVTFHERYRAQMENLCQTWEQTRELPPMGYLFELHPLLLKEHKKYLLVVDEEDKLQAFMACSPIYGKNGWYLEDLIRDQAAPNGCTELLVTETLRLLAMEGYDMATLGLAPLSGLPDNDPERPFLTKLLKFCFEHLSFIYHFKALEHFKAKFHPATWEGNYFCHYRTGKRLTIIFQLLGAFTPFDLPTFVQHKLNSKKDIEKS